MERLAALARLELVLISAGMGLAIVVSLLTGRINVLGITRDKVTGALDPARIQLLIPTLLSGALLLTRLDEMRHDHLISLPSEQLLYVLGGSEGIYLVRKFFQGRFGSKGE